MERKKRDLFGLEREEAVLKQKKIIGAVAAGCALLAILIIFLVSRGRAGAGKSGTESTASVESAVVTAAPEPTQPAQKAETQVNFPHSEGFTEKVTILSTGDNLIHEALYQDAESPDEQGYYDFRPIYAEVKPLIEAADLATVNMETPLATSIGDPSGYPHFNSPRGAGYALIDAGFDVINHANNHIMDMGAEGVYATLDYWAGYDMPVVGAYRSSDDMYDIRILESNGIRVAFLGIAEFLNYDIPSDSRLCVPFFSDGGLVEDLIKTAKAEADIVVVHAHWGEENEDVITDTMSVMSQRMVDWGADIIFGNHTHIVQDLKILTRESDGQLCPVILSGGNFVSGQKERSHLLSGLEVVTAAKNPDTGEVEIENVEYLPVVTHYEGDRKNVRIIPVDKYTDEQAAKHGVVDFEGEPMTKDYLYELIDAHIPSQFIVTTDTISIKDKAAEMALADAAEESAAASVSEDTESAEEASGTDEAAETGGGEEDTGETEDEEDGEDNGGEYDEDDEDDGEE